MELSITRSTMNKRRPCAEAVRSARAAGFRHVELSAEKWRTALEQDRHLLRLLNAEDLSPWHAGWNLRLSWDTARWARTITGAPAAMDLTAGLGARSGTLVLPHVDDTGAPVPGPAEVEDRIGAVADLAAGRGLNVCVEYMGLRPTDPPENGVRTLPGTLDVLARVGRSNVGVLIDSYHWHLSGSPGLSQIPPAMPLWVHFNDAPAGIAPEQLRDEHRVLPGEGVIDLPRLLAELDAWGWTGPVSVEVKHPDLHALPAVDAARIAYRATYDVLDRAGHAPTGVR
ncbi:sugar phosphate isomerase/epimerase family protein [Streptomyces sp. LaPpAH-108]|uniref:sugar phosphate isomerase/epimerase family protein n=1 Tax=Streptomyces sp. LaPpAH-108 TaxID=1155714 RepID=UPI00036F7015|nr:sugar phosphate isomerase/epimerase [Streptomyces sp. LaPpAH-108]